MDVLPPMLGRRTNSPRYITGLRLESGLVNLGGVHYCPQYPLWVVFVVTQLAYESVVAREEIARLRATVTEQAVALHLQQKRVA
jgi:hypothetical protein